ncbi:CRISPR-associated endonuclease Cas2 [Immundisolibacter sp.]|uniref:CRISPR-associated endonuclease Cas2 n=1 Tax=Immundisolibacter sp. TaxID=1934948 RepID=UPI002B170DFD|nr:CRISPR-associated endonuclease Cas2 [Immundisolibacter sp.]MEA3220487.1 CRISPR-associated endoribonuclease Cas2 [Immundisolibacter sp.]
MNTQTWLIAYDVREPRRLVTLHRALKKQALAVQYSVFVGRFTRRGIRHLVAIINSIIAPQDDVRLYPLPQRPDWVFYGRSALPEAVYLLEQGLDVLAPTPDPSGRSNHRQPPAQVTDLKGGNIRS